MTQPDTAEYLAASEEAYDGQPVSGLTALSDLFGKPLTREIDADGFYAAAYVDASGNVIVAYRGTVLGLSAFDIGTLRTDSVIESQTAPKAYADALKFYEEVQSIVDYDARKSFSQPAPIYVTGHSLGGAEAEYVAYATGFAVGGATFGAPGLTGYSATNRPVNFTSYVNYGDPVGNFASDAPGEPGFAPTSGMDHVGVVELVGNPENGDNLALASQGFDKSVSPLLPNSLPTSLRFGIWSKAFAYVALGMAESVSNHFLANYASALGVSVPNLTAQQSQYSLLLLLNDLETPLGDLGKTDFAQRQWNFKTGTLATPLFSLSLGADGTTVTVRQLQPIVKGANVADPGVLTFSLNPNAANFAFADSANGARSTYAFSSATGAIIGSTVDYADGSSSVATFDYTDAAAPFEVANQYSGPNGSGTHESTVTTYEDGTSQVVAYTGGLSNYVVNYSGPEGTGAPGAIAMNIGSLHESVAAGGWSSVSTAPDASGNTAIDVTLVGDNGAVAGVESLDTVNAANTLTTLPGQVVDMATITPFSNSAYSLTLYGSVAINSGTTITFGSASIFNMGMFAIGDNVTADIGLTNTMDYNNPVPSTTSIGAHDNITLYGGNGARNGPYGLTFQNIDVGDDTLLTEYGLSGNRYSLGANDTLDIKAGTFGNDYWLIQQVGAGDSIEVPFIGVWNGNTYYTGANNFESITFNSTILANDAYTQQTTADGGTLFTFSGGAGLTPPPAVTLALADDTGANAADAVTQDPAISGGGEAGLTVVVSEGATVLGSTVADGSGNWSFAPMGLADGVHTLTAAETDAAGNAGSASLTFTLDRAAPVLAISTPAGAVNQAHQTLQGTIDAADQTQPVSIYDNGVLLATVSASAAGTWQADVVLPNGDGPNLITASATDRAGNVGVSATAEFDLDTVAPTLAIASAGGSVSNATQTLIGSIDVADAGETVSVYDGATFLGAVASNGDGSWTLDVVLPSAGGAQMLTAQATDAAGNVGVSAPVGYTLQGASSTSAVLPDGSVSQKFYQDGQLVEAETSGVEGKPWNLVDSFFAPGDIRLFTNFQVFRTLYETETWNPDGSIHDIRRYASGVFSGVAYASYDIGFSGGFRNDETYYDASGGLVAEETFQPNGGYSIFVGGKIVQSRTVNADGSYEVAHFEVAGAAYDAYQDLFDATGKRFAEARDMNDGSGALILFANSVATDVAADTVQVTSGADSFSLAPHARETIQATGLSSQGFSFQSGFGAATLLGWSPASDDTLQFRQSMFGLNSADPTSDWAALVSRGAAAQAGGAVTVVDLAGDVLTLGKTSLATLTANAVSSLQFV